MTGRGYVTSNFLAKASFVRLVVLRCAVEWIGQSGPSLESVIVAAGQTLMAIRQGAMRTMPGAMLWMLVKARLLPVWRGRESPQDLGPVNAILSIV